MQWSINIALLCKYVQYCWYVDGGSNDDDDDDCVNGVGNDDSDVVDVGDIVGDDDDDDDDYPLSFCLCLCCLTGFVLFLTSQSDICSSSVCSSVRTSVCSSVSFCQLTLQLSLSKFCSLSIFSLLLVSGVSRMGRLTAPGVGEDDTVPLLSQGVHSLHLDATSPLSPSLFSTNINNSEYIKKYPHLL